MDGASFVSKIRAVPEIASGERSPGSSSRVASTAKNPRIRRVLFQFRSSHERDGD